MGDVDHQTLRNELRDYRVKVREARAKEAAAQRESAISAREARLVRADLKAANEALKSLRADVAKAHGETESVQAELERANKRLAHRGSVTSDGNTELLEKPRKGHAGKPFFALLGVTVGALVGYFILPPAEAGYDVALGDAQSSLDDADGDPRLCAGESGLDMGDPAESVELTDVVCDESDARQLDMARSSYRAARQIVASRLLRASCPSGSAAAQADLNSSAPFDSTSGTTSYDVADSAGAAEGSQPRDQQNPSPEVELVPGPNQTGITSVWDIDYRHVHAGLFRPAPQLVGLSLDTAVAVAECTGLPIAQVPADPTGISNGLGVVVAQTPRPGTLAQSIRISIGSSS